MSQPAWHADPSGRFHYRWWDGQAWTNQVSSNGVNTVDTNSLEPPNPTQSQLGPEPDLPMIEVPNGDPIVDPLFTEPILHYSEYGNQDTYFGQFQIASPNRGILGHVAQTSHKDSHRYELSSASGRPLAILNEMHVKDFFVLTDPNGRQLGEYTEDQKFLSTIVMPISVAGVQIAEVKYTDGRGTKMQLFDRAGLLASVDRPQPWSKDNPAKNPDNYIVMRHRGSVGFLAYLALMAPVAVDVGSLRRDIRYRQRDTSFNYNFDSTFD